jgi:hypothetical protein
MWSGPVENLTSPAPNPEKPDGRLKLPNKLQMTLNRFLGSFERYKP